MQSVIPTEPDNDPHTDDSLVLLIVEDNPELCNFLTSIFHGEYALLTASNGQESLDKAIELIHDLILTDLSMPVMDGMEMIERLRNHPDTSHIPIVALTARVSVEDQMRGYLLGVRLYVTKPFNATLLRIQIAALIQEQSELQVWALKQLSEKDDEPQPKEAQSEGAQPAVADPAPYVSQYDRQFLEKVKETFQAHLSDCNFGRCFKKVYGQSPSEVIKNRQPHSMATPL